MMRFLPVIASAALLSIVVPCSLAFSRLPAVAADTAQTTSCPSFASVKWANPVTDVSGNEYVVTIMQSAMPCSEATTWVKKFVAQHIGGSPGSHTVVNGPSGYDCVGFPDSAGNAYRGRCEKPGMGAVPGFSWDGKM